MWRKYMKYVKRVDVTLIWHYYLDLDYLLSVGNRCTPKVSHTELRELSWCQLHYNDVIMSSLASQITSLTVAYSTVYSRADLKHQSASLAFVWGIHWGPVNSPHKWPVTRKMLPFDDVIMFVVTGYIRQPTLSSVKWVSCHLWMNF